MTSTIAATRYGNGGGRWQSAPKLEAPTPPTVRTPRTRADLLAHLVDHHQVAPGVLDEYSVEQLRGIHTSEHQYRKHPQFDFIGHTHPVKGDKAAVVDERVTALMARAAAHGQADVA